jgi:hypothetical protein
MKQIPWGEGRFATHLSLRFIFLPESAHLPLVFDT